MSKSLLEIQREVARNSAQMATAQENIDKLAGETELTRGQQEHHRE